MSCILDVSIINSYLGAYIDVLSKEYLYDEYVRHLFSLMDIYKFMDNWKKWDVSEKKN